MKSESADPFPETGANKRASVKKASTNRRKIPKNAPFRPEKLPVLHRSFLQSDILVENSGFISSPIPLSVRVKPMSTRANPMRHRAGEGGGARWSFPGNGNFYSRKVSTKSESRGKNGMIFGGQAERRKGRERPLLIY